jgi:intraflagellar transport protein 172
MYDCALRRVLHGGGKFEFTYVGPGQVIVRQIATGSRLVLKSARGSEISKISVLGGDRYLVAYTPDTLLVADLTACALSEVSWRRTGTERFNFDSPDACLVVAAGELAVIPYGASDILGPVRTEYTNPKVLR